MSLSAGALRKAAENSRMVYERLLDEHPNAQRGFLIDGSVDVRVVLMIDDVKIGIEGQGDPNARLKESLELFVREECRVIVCATRTYGMTVEWVKQLMDRHEVIWFDQRSAPSESEQASRNSEMAVRIVEEVKRVIGEEPSLAREQ
jgi:hypothetical protein